MKVGTHNSGYIEKYHVNKIRILVLETHHPREGNSHHDLFIDYTYLKQSDTALT